VGPGVKFLKKFFEFLRQSSFTQNTLSVIFLKPKDLFLLSKGEKI
jgi:hypothetical protein